MLNMIKRRKEIVVFGERGRTGRRANHVADGDGLVAHHDVLEGPQKVFLERKVVQLTYIGLAEALRYRAGVWYQEKHMHNLPFSRNFMESCRNESTAITATSLLARQPTCTLSRMQHNTVSFAIQARRTSIMATHCL